jgi:hypothetical protein
MTKYFSVSKLAYERYVHKLFLSYKSPSMYLVVGFGDGYFIYLASREYSEYKDPTLVACVQRSVVSSAVLSVLSCAQNTREVTRQSAHEIL